MNRRSFLRSLGGLALAPALEPITKKYFFFGGVYRPHVDVITATDIEAAQRRAVKLLEMALYHIANPPIIDRLVEIPGWDKLLRPYRGLRA